MRGKHVAEVSVLPKDGVLVWPRMCCCCGSTSDLYSIGIYFRAASVGPKDTMHIPYCLKCQSHHGRASVRALASAGVVMAIGVTVLFTALIYGIVSDPIIGFLLQLVLVVGAVVWGVRSYLAARAKIQTGISPECSTDVTPAVVVVTARESRWRLRFCSQAYAEAFTAANPGASLTPWLV